MTDRIIENNQVSIIGKIVSDFSFSHEVFGEGFYMWMYRSHGSVNPMILYRSWYRSV